MSLRAARSPLKILNHLGAISEHEAIEIRLGVHRTTPEPMYSANKAALDKFVHLTRQFRGLGANAPILALSAAALAEDDAELGTAKIRSLLLRYLQGAQVEFHPSDVCNEACRGCTYGHDEAAHKPPAVCFPFDRLGELTKLNPRAMTIVGGGEPLLYRDGPHGFTDLMNRLRELLPECRFGLITNGTLIPTGAWFQHFDWVRISVDAAHPATYAKMRGRDLFHLVTRNLMLMLDGSSIPQVNIGFVFSRENISEAAECARFFYELVKSRRPIALDRLHIEYRPLRRDSKDEGRGDFPEAVTRDDIGLVMQSFTATEMNDKAFSQFLAEQTNREILTLGNTHTPIEFEHCGFSTVFRLVRADGEMRPCCMRLFDPEFCLGNLLTDSPEAIALAVMHNATYLKPGCDAKGCKLGLYNRLTESGASGLVKRSGDSAIASNLFFG